jgi:hypothetical protein
MNRNEARKLAETVSDEDIKQMFINAQTRITDWEQVSRVNKGMTKGAAFNILAKGGVASHILGRTNQIWEFGEFLPNYQKPVKKEKNYPKPFHQDPSFNEEWGFKTQHRTGS